MTTIAERLDWLHQQLVRSQAPLWTDEQTPPRSWAEFSESVARWAHFWQSLPQQRYALYQPNIEVFAAAMLGAWYAGKILYIPNDGLPATVTHLSQWVDGFVGEFACEAHAEFIVLNPTADMDTGQWNVTQKAQYVNSVISAQTPLCFLTSGSTGLPKPIAKTVRQLLLELDVLDRQFTTEFQSSTVYATVSHQHFFGFIFRLLWPLFNGRRVATESILFPEQLLSITDKNILLISSPAFLSRVSTLTQWQQIRGQISAVFSAGGALESEDRTRIEWLWHTQVVEIYGSTETGAVAYKRDSAYFMPLPLVQVSLSAEQLLQLKAPHLDEPDVWYVTADKAQISEHQRFKLLGRSDRIFKLEEKRISLTYMESCLQQTQCFDGVHVVPFEYLGRSFLGVVGVLNAEGQARLNAMGKAQLVHQFKKQLKQSFEALAIPRRWRFVVEIPRNAQDKIAYQSLLNILESSE